MSDKPEHIGLDNKLTVDRDRIDLNLEISGEPTGRIQRFLTENTIGAYGDKNEKKKSERRYHSMLEMLLAEDAQYAALYNKVQTQLYAAQRALNKALSDITQSLEVFERMLQGIINRAAENRDGVKVFQSTIDGAVYTENGERLSDDEARSIHFSENAPSWEEFKDTKDKVKKTKEQLVEIETYKRDVIERAQERIDDENEPPSIEELEKIERDIQAKKPSILSQYFYQEGIIASKPGAHNVTAAHDISGRSPLEMPPMGSQFEKARLDIPDIEVFSVAEKNPTTAPAV